jgi:hypothetical protein
MRASRPWLLGVAAGYAGLQLLGRRAGSTAAERRRTLPGDALVADPLLRTNHAHTVAAPPAAVWPWLAQLGWHLGGYYTPGWVDRLLFPDNWPSLDRLDPALVRELRVGDVIPDGPPGTAAYVVAVVQEPEILVLRSTTHLPPGWAERFGATMDWTWTFALTPEGADRTRLHLRVLGRLSPAWLAATYEAVIVPADFVMAVGMLRGIARRAESGVTPAPSGRVPYGAVAR